MNSVPQRAEPALLCQKGDGPEPLHVVAHPDPQLILVRGALHRPYPHIHRLAAAPQREHHAAAVQVLDSFQEL